MGFLFQGKGEVKIFEWGMEGSYTVGTAVILGDGCPASLGDIAITVFLLYGCPGCLGDIAVTGFLIYSSSCLAPTLSDTAVNVFLLDVFLASRYCFFMDTFPSRWYYF